MTDARSRRAVAVLAVAVALVMSIGLGAAATTWYVDDDGGAGVDFTKIQDAVDAASSRDTIIVYNGTYYENVNINKQLTLEGIDMPVVNAGWSGSAIDVGADGCTVDGFYVTGGWYGIAVESNNNLIKNNIASGTGDGISLSDSSNNNITGNTILNNNHKGIDLHYSNNNNITNNIVSSNFHDGIRLLGSNNNTIIGNIVSNNKEGISIEYYNSGNNKLRNNILQDNVYNIHVGGWSLPDYHQDIDTSNTVNGKPIYYWVEEKDKTIDGSTDAGYVALISCNNIVVKDLDLTNNGEGILLVNTTNSTLQDNTISNCGTGIDSTYFSNNNDIEGNTLSNNHEGISIFGSNNTLTGNDLLDNSYLSIDVFGYTKDYYNNQIDITNAINGKPVYYYFDQDDTVIEDLDTCHLTLAFCSNITLKSNTVNGGDGIMLRFSDNSSITGCTVSLNNVDGIYLYHSDDTTIADNKIRDNSHYGIFIGASNNNTVTGNDVSNNDDGIDIFISSNNTLSSNTLNSNGDGISLHLSNDNILSDNEVSDNDDPDCIESTGIDLGDSDNNIIARNNVSNNDVGIKLEDSSSNSIYHNNLIGNTDHAYDDDGTNSWDNGYPSGGYYWSDYEGKYPDAEELGESGIWDTPYDILGGAGAKDDYPLMEPWDESIKETEYWAVIVGGTATMSYKDATCLYNALMSSSNWKDDHIQVLVDDAATYSDIRSAIEDWMASQADSDDICLFFFSGHGGVGAEDPDAGYICTYDGPGIKDIELKMWLKKLPADDVVVILNSCHSGAFIEDIKEDVHVVLTACGAIEESSVHGHFENCLLPFYVTQGLLGAADTDKNKKISVEELIDFSKERHNPAQFSDKYPTTDLNLLTMPPTSGIQKMVEDAEVGDTIEISGTYNEHVIIDKTLTIAGNDATIENSFGCFYISADGVTINGFTLKDGRYGIYLDSSNNSILFNNNVSNNIGGGGICLLSSDKTTIHNNAASNNLYFGITLFSSNDNIMTDNNISYITGYPRSAGISLNSADGNMIKNNDITENGNGIMLLDSSNNLIYHNDLINNVDAQAYDSVGNTNLWDNDYPSGGNYWSDYGAKYPDAEEIDASGIWDTPYDISGRAGAQDRHPLMHPWTGDTPRKGDLNSDGTLTPADAAIALRIAATGAHDPAADVSGDGVVTSLDALMILQAAADRIEL